MSTQDNANEEFLELEEAVRDLPREIRPGRDLWPEIADRISIPGGHLATGRHWWNSPILSAASLVIATAAVTFALTRPGAVATDSQGVVPVSMEGVLDQGFLANRKRLESKLEGRLAELSPEMQGVVRQNLASIRGSLRAMSMALASDPGNADLQDLLLSTYEQELQVMTEISQMPETSARRIDL